MRIKINSEGYLPLERKFKLHRAAIFIKSVFIDSYNHYYPKLFYWRIFVQKENIFCKTFS